MISRLRVDLDLVWSFLRCGGLPRAVVIALCTALVSGLLMVALAVVLFTWVPHGEREVLSNLVADKSMRGGYVVALLLICLAPLVLLQQVVRLGTTAREQRLAALRLAGATMGDVRRLGALEVGLPSLAGGFLGYGVFRLLGVAFGGATWSYTGTDFARFDLVLQFRLVPTAVHPPWWALLLVALGVGLLGVCAGALTSRSLVISPLGVSRRAPGPAPRPWALLLLALAAALFSFIPGSSDGASILLSLGVLGAVVLGLLALAPWLAYRIGRTVAERASTVPVLIAGRRLATDPRPAGRAAAAVGVIALVTGGGGAVLVDALTTNGGFQIDPFFAVPLTLGGLMLLAALVLVVFSLAVHGVESLIDHRRSVASLAALGLSRRELEAAQRWEVGLVAIPMAVIGVYAGSVPLMVVMGEPSRYDWIPFVVDAVAVALVWVAVRASTRLTRPWLVRAAAPASLRTP